MRKKMVYQVKGVSDSKPTDLPDGFKVEELEVDGIETLEIRAFHFADSGMYENGVFIKEDPTSLKGRHLTKEETREVRDFLNKVLGEDKFTGRVLVDDVRDVWFEFEPNVWTQGNDLHDTDPNPLQRARQRLPENEPPGLVRQPLSEIERKYGPVRFIENIWED